MRALRFLLRPGWIVVILLVAAFAYLAFTVLAPWQLHKNSDTQERNDRISHALTVDPVPVTELLDAAGGLAPADEWRRVILRGHYVTDDEILLRLRNAGGNPAVHALTPLRLDTGRLILVNRGSAPLGDGGLRAVPPPAPGGEVTLLGHLRTSEGTSPDKEPRVIDGRRTATTIDTTALRAAYGLPLLQPYVQLDDGQPGALTAVPLPELTSGPHLSYGLQWIAFGVLVPVGLGYFAWAEMRERRREREQAAADPGAGAGSAADTARAPADTGTTAAPQAPTTRRGRGRRGGFDRDTLWDAEPELPEDDKPVDDHLVERYGRG